MYSLGLYGASRDSRVEITVLKEPVTQNREGEKPLSTAVNIFKKRDEKIRSCGREGTYLIYLCRLTIQDSCWLSYKNVQSENLFLVFYTSKIKKTEGNQLVFWKKKIKEKQEKANFRYKIHMFGQFCLENCFHQLYIHIFLSRSGYAINTKFKNILGSRINIKS